MIDSINPPSQSLSIKVEKETSRPLLVGLIVRRGWMKDDGEWLGWGSGSGNGNGNG